MNLLQVLNEVKKNDIKKEFSKIYYAVKNQKYVFIKDFEYFKKNDIIKILSKTDSGVNVKLFREKEKKDINKYLSKITLEVIRENTFIPKKYFEQLFDEKNKYLKEYKTFEKGKI